MYRFPVGKCPKCKHSVIYSNNPKDKNNISITFADDNSVGIMILCSKCKTMLKLDNMNLK